MASTSIVSGRRHRLRKISCLTAATALGFSLSVTAGPAAATEDGCSSKTTHGEQVKSKSEAKQGSARSCGGHGANHGEVPADKNDVGQGKLSVDSSELKKDGTVTLKGEGFAEFKSEGKFAVKFEGAEGTAEAQPDAGLPEGQPCGKVDSSGDLDVTDQNFLPKADGTFALKVKVPEITVKGEYWVRVVGTTSTGVTVEKWASFKATSTTSSSSSSAGSSNATDDSSAPKPSPAPSDSAVTPIGPPSKPSASPSATPSADPSTGAGKDDSSKDSSSKKEVKITRVQTDSNGVITARVTGSGFTSKSEISAVLSQKTVSWSVEGKTVESIKVGADGTFSGTIRIEAGVALAGKQTLTLTDSAGLVQTAEFSASASFSFSAKSTVGSTSTVKVVNVPEGAEITSIGTASSVWYSQSVKVSGSSTVEIPNVTIPQDAKVGERIVVTYKINGQEFACETGAVVQNKDGSSDANKDSGKDGSTDKGSSDANKGGDSKDGGNATPNQDASASKAPDTNGDANKDSGNNNANNQKGDPKGNFDVKSGELPKGLYQSAYNAQSNFLFVTTVSGKAPSTQTKLLKVDASTLKVVASVTPGSDDEGGLYGVYGIALDNANGYIWTTNTQQGTVAVYEQATLKLVKQFKASEQTTSQASSIVVDEQTHMAYVSSANSNYIDVYSAGDGQPKFVRRIQLSTSSQSFEGVQSLSFDPASGMLYTVSLKSQVAVSINVRASYQVNYFQLGDSVRSASGVAFDATRNYLFIASRQSNNLVVVNTLTGQVVANIPTGNQALSVSYDSTKGLVYVVNRRGGTVTVVSSVTLKVVGQVTVGTNPNHVTTANGQVFVVNRDNPNLIFRITNQDIQAGNGGNAGGNNGGNAGGSNNSNNSGNSNGSNGGNAGGSNNSDANNGSNNSNGTNGNRENTTPNANNGGNAGGSDNNNGGNAGGNNGGNAGGSDNGNGGNAGGNNNGGANNNGGNAGGNNGGNAGGSDNGNGGNAGGNGSDNGRQAATPNGNNGGNAGGSDNNNAGNNGGNAGGANNGNGGGNAGGADNGRQAAAPNNGGAADATAGNGTLERAGAGSGNSTAKNNSGLANTGANVTVIGLVALLLVALGGVALRFRARKAE